MYKFFLLVLLVLITHPTSAQQSTPPADSLREALTQHTIKDTTRVWLLVQLANAVFTDQPAEGLKYAEDALQLSDQLNWQQGRALALNAKGGIYYMQSDYTLALDLYLQALSTGVATSNKRLACRIANNLGNIYGELKQYEKCLTYYFESLKLAEALNSKEDEAIATGNIGTIYQENKKLDSAMLFYKEALLLAEAVSNKRLIANILCTTGLLYKEMGKYDSSIHYSTRSIAVARESGNSYVLAPALNNLAMAYLPQGKYREAETYSRQSLKLAEELQVIQWQSEAWETLSLLYEKMQDPVKALEAYKTFTHLRDSVVNDEKKQDVVRMEVQYKAAQREAVLKAEHAAGIQHQHFVRNLILGGTACLLLAGAIIFVFYKRRRDAEFRAQMADMEMKVFRLQMNPHFIFNSLNSIADYIARNELKAAEDYLVKFSGIMRLILENSAHKEVLLSEDLKALELYMQLEALRMEHKFTWSIEVEKEIDVNNTLIPPMILQPYVENSIWHGIARKEGAGKIMVNVTQQNGMIHCLVEDNGIGRRPQAAAESRSTGMKITKSRIELLKKGKGVDAHVAVYDLPSGTRVEVVLPLETAY